MPIKQDILDLLRKNDLSLTKLELSEHSGIYLTLKELLLTLSPWHDDPELQLTIEDMIALFDALVNNTVLTSLKFFTLKLGKAGAAIIAKYLTNNRTLQKLELYYTDIGDEGVIGIAKSLANNKILQELVLYNTDIEDEGAIGIAQSLANNGTLQKLNLWNNNIGDQGAIAIAQSLANNHALLVLGLMQNKIGDQGAIAIAQSLENNTTLLHLWIGGSNVSDEGSIAIAHTLVKNNTLQRVVLLGKDIGDKGAICIAQSLVNNGTLQELELWNNKIGDQGAIAIAQSLANNHTLQKLNLYCNKIGEKGAIALAKSLASNSTLHLFSLSKTNIGEKGAIAIAQSLAKNNVLQILCLKANNIGDHGAISIAQSLASNNSLQTLNLLENDIGDEGAIAIIKMLENNYSIQKIRLEEKSISGFNLYKIEKLLRRNQLAKETEEKSNKSAHEEQKANSTHNTSKDLTATNPPNVLEPSQQLVTTPTTLPMISEEKKAELITSGINVTECLTVLTTLQLKQTVLYQGIAQWEVEAQKNAIIQAELKTIRAQAALKEYYEVLKRSLEQTCLAAMVVASYRVPVESSITENIIDGMGKVADATTLTPGLELLGVGTNIIEGISTVASVITMTPVLGLIGATAKAIDETLTLRKLQRHARWMSLANIPAFADTLARYLTLLKQDEIKEPIDLSEETMWDRISQQCILFLRSIKEGKTFTDSEKHAILDATKIFKYMLTHDKPEDANVEAAIKVLISYMTGPEHKSILVTTSSDVQKSNNEVVLSHTTAMVLMVAPAATQSEVDVLRKQLVAVEADRKTEKEQYAKLSDELATLRKAVNKMKQKQTPDIDVAGGNSMQCMMQKQSLTDDDAYTDTLTHMLQKIDKLEAAIAEVGNQMKMTKEDVSSIHSASVSRGTATGPAPSSSEKPQNASCSIQ